MAASTQNPCVNTGRSAPADISVAKADRVLRIEKRTPQCTTMSTRGQSDNVGIRQWREKAFGIMTMHLAIFVHRSDSPARPARGLPRTPDAVSLGPIYLHRAAVRRQSGRSKWRKIANAS